MNESVGRMRQQMEAVTFTEVGNNDAKGVAYRMH
jgi:hypothetical protein